MPSPSSDPVAHELQALRQTLETLTQRVGELADDNRRLRAQLEASQAARTDLVAQAEHLIGMLDHSRREIRASKGEAG